MAKTKNWFIFYEKKQQQLYVELLQDIHSHSVLTGTPVHLLSEAVIQSAIHVEAAQYKKSGRYRSRASFIKDQNKKQ